MNWATIKDIAGALVATLVVILAIGATYMEWRISVAVSEKIDAVALQQISPDKITEIEGNIAETRQQHLADSTRMDGKIERIVDILLEE